MKIFNIKRTKTFLEKGKKRISADTVFSIIQIAILILAIALFFYEWKLGVISVMWCVINASIYHKASTWICVDEYETSYPDIGLKVMLKSWKVLLPLLSIAAVLVLINYPLIALIYGIMALLFFIAYQDMVLFDF